MNKEKKKEILDKMVGTMKDQVKNEIEGYLRDIIPYSNSKKYTQYLGQRNQNIQHLNWYIFTDTHDYSISASFDKHPIKNNYLGCIASARKPRAGETWTRGNDLPDGRLNRITWKKIKNSILRYELIPLSDYILNPDNKQESISK